MRGGVRVNKYEKGKRGEKGGWGKDKTVFT
jgi:hypothetical protein